MAEIDILMAAYNGERFIAEQIDSLLNQTFQDFRLLIRDDGSSDNTPAIIESYARKYPGKIEIVHDDVVCKNPTKNFMELLKHARADYVMFCDQDDYWLPYKIQVTLWHMKEAERKNPGVPVMVFSGMRIVDENLRSMGKLMSVDVPEKRYTFRELLPCNCTAGCTQMMNRIMYEDLGEWRECIKIHDWWTSLYASAFGVMEHIPAALMLYRQHAHNAIGVGQNQYRPGGEVQRILHKLKRPFEELRKGRKNYSNDREYVELFAERYHDKLSPEVQGHIREHMKLFGKSRIGRIIAIYKLDYMFNKRPVRKFIAILKAILL